MGWRERGLRRVFLLLVEGWNEWMAGRSRMRLEQHEKGKECMGLEGRGGERRGGRVFVWLYPNRFYLQKQGIAWRNGRFNDNKDS